MSEAQTAQRRSVWVTHIETSGCGACAQSIAGLQATRFAQALRDEDIHFALSPRHADVILLSGALTTKARDAVSRALAATPQPHALVAVGDCAIDGCVFRGSHDLVESLAEQLDVNVEIAGCPPQPQAILAAILEAKALLVGAQNTDTAAKKTMANGGETPAVVEAGNEVAGDEEADV